MIFWKKDMRIVSSETIDLGDKKIALFELNRRMVDKANIKATLGSTKNSYIFIREIENQIVDISQKEFDLLPIEQSARIREYIKNKLIKLGLIEEGKSEFSPEDKVWFEKSPQKLLEKMKNGNTRPSRKHKRHA